MKVRILVAGVLGALLVCAVRWQVIRAEEPTIEWKLPLQPETKKKAVEAALGVEFDKDDCRTVGFYDVRDGDGWALRSAGYALRVRRSMGTGWGACERGAASSKSKVTLKLRGDAEEVARANTVLRNAASQEGHPCSGEAVTCKREVDREVGGAGVHSLSLTLEREKVESMASLTLAAGAPGLSSLGVGEGLVPVCMSGDEPADIVETTWKASWPRRSGTVKLDLTRWEDASGRDLVREVSFRGTEADAEALAAALGGLRGPSGSKTALFYGCR